MPLHDSRSFVAMLATVGIAALWLPGRASRAADPPVDPEAPEAPAEPAAEPTVVPPPAKPKAAAKKVTPKPASSATIPTKRKPDREAGRDLYLQSCWQCHGETGQGDGPASAALVGGVPSLVPLWSGTSGGPLPGAEMDRLVALVLEGKGRMPAYREDIDKHQARRILLYLGDAVNGKTEAIDEKPDTDDATDNEN